MLVADLSDGVWRLDETASGSRLSYAISISVILFIVLGFASTLLLVVLRRREVQS